MIPSRIMPTYLQLFFEMMIFRNSIRSGMEFYYQWLKTHLMTSWKHCTNQEYESLRNSRPYWNCMTWRSIRRKEDLIITDWRRWWKEVSSKFYETGILGPETEIMKETLWSRIKGQSSVDKEFLEIVGNGKPTSSVLKETIAVSVTILTGVQKWHSRIRLRVLSCSRMREMRQKPEVPEEEVPVVECFDCHARITSKELAPIHSVKSGTLQNACSTRPWVVADPGKSALMRIARLMNSLVKGPKRMVTKVHSPCLRSMSRTIERGNPVVCRDTSHERHGPVVYNLSNTRQLGCVFQDMEPPKSSSILRKSSDMRKPNRRVKFTKAVVRHAYIRDQNPSLGLICPGEPH